MNNKTVSASLGEQALELLDAERDGAISSEELHEWMTQSPQHVQEVISIVVPQCAAKGFSCETRAAMLALVTPTSASPNDQIWPLPQESPWRNALWSVLRPAIGVLGAAAFIGLIFVTLSMIVANEWQHYETQVGQSVEVDLSDGTIASLNTGTQLEARISPKLRELRILRGEVLLDVSPDPLRPFVVDAGRARVKALGTDFDVRREASYVDVAVRSGLVAVSYRGKEMSPVGEVEWRVPAGSGIRVTDQGSMSPMTSSQFTNAVGWGDGVLRFDDEKLSVLAEEFNRYNRKPKIYVEGEAADKRFSGVFDYQSPERLISLISADPAYDVTKEGDSTVIRLRHAREN